jgi:hypothetical protein
MVLEMVASFNILIEFSLALRKFLMEALLVFSLLLPIQMLYEKFGVG